VSCLPQQFTVGFDPGEGTRPHPVVIPVVQYESMAFERRIEPRVLLAKVAQESETPLHLLRCGREGEKRWVPRREDRDVDHPIRVREPDVAVDENVLDGDALSARLDQVKGKFPPRSLCALEVH